MSMTYRVFQVTGSNEKDIADDVEWIISRAPPPREIRTGVPGITERLHEAFPGVTVVTDPQPVLRTQIRFGYEELPDRINSDDTTSGFERARTSPAGSQPTRRKRKARSPRPA